MEEQRIPIPAGYRQEKVLKAGQDSWVLLLRREVSGQRVVYRRYVGDGAAYERLQGVQCSHLPRILETKTENGVVTEVEEYIPGDDLEFLLRGGVLSPKTATDIVCQLILEDVQT